MDASRWERLQFLFHLVADLQPEQQRAVLAQECAAEPALIEDVLQMLDRDKHTASILDQPLGVVADQMLSRPPLTPVFYKRVGPYELQSVLGEGGMGTVFFAVRGDLGTPAAIKILRDSWVSPARRDRFAREQYTLARLDHPNIARLLDASTLEDGTPYFVMEYVEGLHLDKHCNARHCTITERLRLVRSVCEAVQFAHQHAVIHRDLKPSNILVKADGTVKLLDFGIAKQLDEFNPAADITRIGLRMMTPAFAAPEQLRGEPAAVGSDVYSLGVILYRLLAGRLPFDENSGSSEHPELAAARDVVRPSLVARRVAQQAGVDHRLLGTKQAAWADLDVICLTAMHNDASKRYSSAEALLRDIDHYLKGEPLEARPDAVGYRVSKFIRRHRVAVASSAAALIATAALGTLFMMRLATERNTAVAEAARTQRIQQFMRNLFEGGDRDAGPASDLRVAAVLDRGVLEARALDKDPAVQAELFLNLAEIYRKLGDLPRADELFTAALDRHQAVSGPDSPAVAETTAALVLLRVDQARLNEAERLSREALDMSRRKLPSSHPVIAAATDSLGRVLEEKGSYAEAISVLEEAVRLRSAAHHSASDLAASLYELANVYFYAGRYKDSEALNRRVLQMNREIYGESHPRVAEALVNLGAIQQDLGNYREAERFQQQALGITRAFFGETHYRTAAGFTMVARSLVYQKRFDEAVVLLKQALAIQERVFGGVHPRVASALNELGTVALQRGDWVEAKADFRRMVEIYRSVYAGEHYLVGTALSNLASVYMAERDNHRAESLFREAVAIFTRTQSADHLNTAIARVKLGRTLLRQKQFKEAEIETLAGYSILKKQMNPSVSWLNSARTDLAEIYAALGTSEKAAVFRTELAANTKK